MILLNDNDQRTSGEVWRDRLLTVAAAVVLGLTLSNVAPADDTSDHSEAAAKAEYKASMDKARAEYKAEKERCDSLSGNDKDVCHKDAKAAYKRAQADAKQARKTSDLTAEAGEDRREADYKVAKERCDALTGNDKDVCEKEAAAKYRQ
jgi:hypothetical protein